MACANTRPRPPCTLGVIQAARNPDLVPLATPQTRVDEQAVLRCLATAEQPTCVEESLHRKMLNGLEGQPHGRRRGERVLGNQSTPRSEGGSCPPNLNEPPSKHRDLAGIPRFYKAKKTSHGMFHQLCPRAVFLGHARFINQLIECEISFRRNFRLDRKFGFLFGCMARSRAKKFRLLKDFCPSFP